MANQTGGLPTLCGFIILFIYYFLLNILPSGINKVLSYFKLPFLPDNSAELEIGFPHQMADFLYTMLCSSGGETFAHPLCLKPLWKITVQGVKVQRLYDLGIFWNATSHQSSGAFWGGFVWLIKRRLPPPSVPNKSPLHRDPFPSHRVNTVN